MLRSAALALSCLAASVLVAGQPSPAVSRPRPAPVPSGIVVDVSRLRALGLGQAADRLQAAVARELAGAAGGGRIVVQLTGLSLASYAGSDGGGGGGASGSGGTGGVVDYLEGDFQVIGAGGQVLAQRHQVSTSPASSGGAYYLPGADERRIEAAGRTFALWVKRAVD